MSKAIVQQVPNAGALNAERYQTFEMAKTNDDILGGDNIAQIRSYAAYARAQAQAIHKSIATMGALEDVAQAKAEMTETSQTFAKVSVYADTRIGELLRGIEQAKRGPKVNSDTQEKTKADAIADAGISKSQAYDLQAMAANPEVVEAVITKATEEGRIVSRSQVLKAINEKKQAERELQKASITQTNLEMEVESLRQQLEEQPEPKVIEREVVREVESEESKCRIATLEHEVKVYLDTDQKLRKQLESTRKKLDRAKVLLEEKGYEDNASWDISTLTSATNQYLRNYGGKAWAFDQFYRVDEVTQQEFVKAITSLAAFSQNLVQMISDKSKLEA